MPREAPPSDNLYVTDLPSDIDDTTLKEVFSAYGVVSQCRVLRNPTSGLPGGHCAALVRFTDPEEAAWIVENLNGNIPQGLTEPVGVRFADTPEMKAQRGAKGWGKEKGGGKGDSRPSPYGGGMQRPGGYGKGDGGYGGYGKGDGGYGGYGKGDGGYGGCGKGDGGHPGPPMGKAGKGSKGGKGKAGGYSIQVLHDGLLTAQALPGGAGYTNDENALYIANLPPDTTDVDLYKIFSTFGAIAPKGVRAMLYPDGTCKGIGFVNYLEPMATEAAVTTLHGTGLPDGTQLIVRSKAPPRQGGKDGGKDGGKGDPAGARQYTA